MKILVYPDGQAEHERAPALEKKPIWQGVQPVQGPPVQVPVPAYTAAHVLQDVDPVSRVVYPKGQKVHKGAPPALKKPTWQAVQPTQVPPVHVPVTLPEKPAAHLLQEFDPVCEVVDPEGQGEHVRAPAIE